MSELDRRGSLYRTDPAPQYRPPTQSQQNHSIPNGSLGCCSSALQSPTAKMEMCKEWVLMGSYDSTHRSQEQRCKLRPPQSSQTCVVGRFLCGLSDYKSAPEAPSMLRVMETVT